MWYFKGSRGWKSGGTWHTGQIDQMCWLFAKGFKTVLELTCFGLTATYKVLGNWELKGVNSKMVLRSLKLFEVWWVQRTILRNFNIKIFRENHPSFWNFQWFLFFHCCAWTAYFFRNRPIDSGTLLKILL
jgi:hypothetical protein